MRLFTHCRPTAIVWAITFVIVFSVQSQCFAVAVSGSPMLEANKINPFVTNGYSSSTVIAVRTVREVGASLVHPLPNFVQPAARLAVHDFGFFVAAPQTEISGISLIGSPLNDNTASGANERVCFSLHHAYSVDESMGCVNAYGVGFLTDDTDEG